MKNFEIGDIITGNKSSDEKYGYTTSKAIMEVVSIYSNDRIDVKILNHSKYHNRIGEVFTVNSAYFKVFETNQEDLQDLFLNFLIEEKLPVKLKTLNYKIVWTKNNITVGCQTISKQDALKLAEAIQIMWGY